MKNNNPGCLSIFFPLKKKEQNSAWDQPEQLYSLNKTLLSPAELTFYKALANITGPKAVIQSKVRLGDIFTTNTREYAHRNKINQKHIDFLLCEAESMKPILGIELDDKSHQRADRLARDSFVEDVFEMAGLPLLRVPVQREYNVQELAVVIRKKINLADK